MTFASIQLKMYEIMHNNPIFPQEYDILPDGQMTLIKNDMSKLILANYILIVYLFET